MKKGAINFLMLCLAAMLGGDFLGYGPANDYHPTGNAKVRNVRLPAGHPHSLIPYAKGLLKNPAVKRWIDNYQPNPHRENGSSSGGEWTEKTMVSWNGEAEC